MATALTSAFSFFGWTSGAATLTAQFLAYSATTFAMNKAMEALSRAPGKTGAGSSLELSQIDTAADGRVIYGSVRVGGIHVIPPIVSGNDGAILHQVLALAVHEVDSLGSVWLDDLEITNGEITAITGSLNDGKVTGSSKYKDVAWLRRYTGTTTQNVDFILNASFPSSFSSTFRGRGIPYIASAFDWGDGKTYTGGVPNVAVLVNGKVCYDPRLDSSPGADPTNPAFAALTSNPALVWADYKLNTIYGQKVSAGDIDWDTVVDAADICDELVSVPTGATQPRYTLNGVFSTNVETTDNEKFIIDAMMGKIAFDGKWRIFAGAWRAPEFSIDYTDWVQVSAIQLTAPRNDSRFNGVACYHVNSEREWQRVECPRRYNDTYKSADGGERIWIEMEQPFCLSVYEAQRKAEYLLRQSRNGVRIVGSLPPSFMKLRTWDNVTVVFPDLGYTAKTFTAAGVVPRPDGGVDVTLVEEQESDWDDLLEADYRSGASTSPVPAVNATKPSAPSSFTLTELLGVVQFDFGTPVTKPVGTRYQLIRSNASLANVNSFAAGVSTIVWEGDVTRHILPGDMRSYYWYHGRCVTDSYFSALMPNTFGTGGRPWIGPEAQPGNRGYPDGELFFASGSYWISAGFRAAHSYFLVNSGGIKGERGRVIIVANSDNWSDGAGTAGQTRLHPTRFDANSRASFIGVPIFPGQSGTAMCVYRRNAAGMSAQMRVAPISVNSPKATDFGAQLLSVNINDVSVNSEWSVAIASFTMPSSTVYDAVTMFIRLSDNSQPNGMLEIGGLQIATL